MAQKKKAAAIPLSPLAQSLLDAQVQHLLSTLTGDDFLHWAQTEIDEALAAAKKIKLGSVVTPAMIKDTARAYAAEMELGEGLPEMVAEIARALYSHDIHSQTRLSDLLTDHRFNEILNQILELHSAREKLIHAAVGSPIYGAIASEMLYEGITGYLAHNPLTRNIPGASSVFKLGKSMMKRANPGLEDSIEEGLKSYVSKSVQATARNGADLLLKNLDDNNLRKLAQSVWKHIKPMKLDALREDISALHVEEFFVSGYEFWRELRKTRIYGVLIDAGIDVFFKKYGNKTLDHLLADLGVTRAMMLQEAQRYAPALQVLHPWLEKMLRRSLTGFYQSPAFAAASAKA